jgi:hypothetical protein
METFNQKQIKNMFEESNRTCALAGKRILPFENAVSLLTMRFEVELLLLLMSSNIR